VAPKVKKTARRSAYIIYKTRAETRACCDWRLELTPGCAVGVWALGVVRPAGYQRILIARCKDATAAVRRSAARGLGARRVRRGAKALARLIDDRDRHVRRVAVHALARLGDAGLPGLRRALSAKKPLALKLLALRALGGMRSVARALKALRRAARRGAALVRLMAARELLARGDKSAARALVALLARSKNKGHRLQAIATLARDQSAIGRRALERCTRSRDPQQRQAAVDALAERKARSRRR